ncbi:extradiol ring-cleavage class 3 subunit b [Grosmannia clavigera kw1407]|uniref:Extradiol ring-cleavage class 3 subunit b n=1 Tax=Grosmannia clavigera (strain kw1407 / UAMH 11150) TaxID=655863 RepID=F0XQD8_GROCL|nr:extradiol ring-cleavage class 3 subunit b [Grosmannia clavigera kw1407]EFX00625.1 extradiol ring-cleavage class 3 subunit b [Grosmannia clavigera kw1407]
MRLSLRVPAILVTAAGAALLAYKARRFVPTTTTVSAFLSTSSWTANVNRINETDKFSMARAAVVALSHGGGPMPVLGDPDSQALAGSMRTRVPAILGLEDAARRPRAIVLVTAHWSTTKPTISAGPMHKLLYDYGGFPEEAYSLRYDAPGSPEVAGRVAELLRGAGFDPQLDLTRGWDHGVFVPLLLVRPQADIPVVQLSVLRSEDPAQHFAMGRALAALRDENIAIVGSGFASFHNLRLMFSGLTHDPTLHARLSVWNDAVSAAAAVPDAGERDARFRQWRTWPDSYIAHPNGGAEHFLPLIVCAGAAGDVAAKSYADDYLGLNIHSYYWD